MSLAVKDNQFTCVIHFQHTQEISNEKNDRLTLNHFMIVSTVPSQPCVNYRNM